MRFLFGSAGKIFCFFSSRRRHTRCLSDWSSDVCSSDPLLPTTPIKNLPSKRGSRDKRAREQTRSEERRVGKEWRSRWAPYHLKKKKFKLIDTTRPKRDGRANNKRREHKKKH